PWYPSPPAQGAAFRVPDLTPIHLPECHTEKNGNFWRGMFDHISRRADLVVTYSEHTRLDVVRTLGIPAERVVAIPLGYHAEFRPAPEARVVPALTALGLRYRRYLLTVGTVE